MKFYELRCPPCDFPGEELNKRSSFRSCDGFEIRLDGVNWLVTRGNDVAVIGAGRGVVGFAHLAEPKPAKAEPERAPEASEEGPKPQPKRKSRRRRKREAMAAVMKKEESDVGRHSPEGAEPSA